MAWIESHQELARHPKTKRLSRKLGVNVPTAIGHLHMLWWWALDYAQDGNITAYESEDIAEAVDWPVEKSETLMQALLESGFVDEIDDIVMVHDWFDYAGRLVDKREQNKERKRKSRAKKDDELSSHTPVTRDNLNTISDEQSGHGATEPNPTEPYPTIPNHTSTKQNLGKNSPAGVGIDPAYNPFRLFEAEGFGTISSVIADKLNIFIDDYGERWVCEAMKAAVIAGKRNLTYVRGILQRYQADGVDEPWNVERKVTSTNTNQSYGRPGKPQIPIVSEDKAKKSVSEEELNELRKLAKKLDGNPIPEPVGLGGGMKWQHHR